MDVCGRILTPLDHYSLLPCEHTCAYAGPHASVHMHFESASVHMQFRMERIFLWDSHCPLLTLQCKYLARYCNCFPGSHESQKWSLDMVCLPEGVSLPILDCMYYCAKLPFLAHVHYLFPRGSEWPYP